MIIDFIIEDLMLNSYLQKNFHTLESSAQYFIIGNPIVTSDLVIAYRNGAYLSTYANAFIEITQKFFAQTIL